MLIHSPQHSTADLERFSIVERTAEIHAQSKRYRERVRRATDALLAFTATGNCYAGVSWGKDSVALAHLISVSRVRVPLVWVIVEPICNPHCAAVRDVFLRHHPNVDYHEVTVHCRRDGDGWHSSGTLESGFREAQRRFGTRHISGIRGTESGIRKMRMMRFGESSANSCAPIGFWSDDDLWAYTFANKLPIHPAYAFTLDGALDPGKLRVAALDGKRGTGFGRAEWEQRYYGEALSRLR